MRLKLHSVLTMNNFFTVLKSEDNIIQYNIKMPSMFLMNNVYFSWLQSILVKTHKNMTLYTHQKYIGVNRKPSKIFGYLDNNVIKYKESRLITKHVDDIIPKNKSDLKLSIFVPKQDSMQYFIQWQRYRKYWWSSITTTPSLFTVNEINYESETADATIVANFPWGPHTVETIEVNSKDTIPILNNNMKNQNMTHLSCSMSLECALFTLLLDGMHNYNNEEYLRLHRNMTPYKISFAINHKDIANKNAISELAMLMHHKLKKNDISSFLPNFTLSVEEQLKENLQLGVAYTAVLCENTLSNGILNLLNSSTLLKEQIHVADFDTYAKYLFKS